MNDSRGAQNSRIGLLNNGGQVRMNTKREQSDLPALDGSGVLTPFSYKGDHEWSSSPHQLLHQSCSLNFLSTLNNAVH